MGAGGGGFTAAQFNEKRLPTLQELNDIAPDTPVFLLHLYDRALLNRAALRACGYNKDTPIRRVGRSCVIRWATRPGCCWPSPTR